MFPHLLELLDEDGGVAELLLGRVALVLLVLLLQPVQEGHVDAVGGQALQGAEVDGGVGGGLLRRRRLGLAVLRTGGSRRLPLRLQMSSMSTLFVTSY